MKKKTRPPEEILSFVNCEGKTVQLPGSLTIKDLVKMGIKFWMEPQDSPPPTDKTVFVYTD